MGFAVWTLIIIAVAVAILSNAFGGEAPKRDAERRERPNRPRAGGSEEVDRFLQEMNRRRQEAAERQRRQAAEAAPRPRPPKPARAPVVRRATPELVRRTPAVEVVVEPSARPVPVDVPEVIPVVPAAEASPPPPPPPRPAPARPVSPAAEQLVTFLKSKQSLRGAILLHEVLGPPRCRRQH